MLGFLLKFNNQVPYSGSSIVFLIWILYFLLIFQVPYLGFYSSSLLGFLIPHSYSGSLSRFLVFLRLLINFLNQAGGRGSVLCSFGSSCKAVWKTVIPLPLLGITRSPARGYLGSKIPKRSVKIFRNESLESQLFHFFLMNYQN